MAPINLVLVGIRGSVIALDRGSGQEVWTTRLKGSGFVNLQLDGDRVYGTTAGEIFCLRLANGHLLWHNRLRGFGQGLATLVAPGAAQGTSPAAAAQHLADEEAAAASVAASSVVSA